MQYKNIYSFSLRNKESYNSNLRFFYILNMTPIALPLLLFNTSYLKPVFPSISENSIDKKMLIKPSPDR